MLIKIPELTVTLAGDEAQEINKYIKALESLIKHTCDSCIGCERENKNATWECDSWVLNLDVS